MTVPPSQSLRKVGVFMSLQAPSTTIKAIPFAPFYPTNPPVPPLHHLRPPPAPPPLSFPSPTTSPTPSSYLPSPSAPPLPPASTHIPPYLCPLPIASLCQNIGNYRLSCTRLIAPYRQTEGKPGATLPFILTKKLCIKYFEKS